MKSWEFEELGGSCVKLEVQITRVMREEWNRRRGGVTSYLDSIKGLSILPFLLLAFAACRETPALKPMIGSLERPRPEDSICPIPIFLPMDVRVAGYQVCDTVPDFCLYSLDGEEFVLSERLAEGLPILLVNASYTCPFWRELATLPDRIAEHYEDQLQVFLVYTVEAHPDGEACPLTGNSWIPDENLADSIFLRQARTYGERIDVSRDMVEALAINVPVLVDDPCNSWWSAYGPAANTAYLLRPDGTVAARHLGLNFRDQDIWCDIDRLLVTEPFGNQGGS